MHWEATANTLAGRYEDMRLAYLAVNHHLMGLGGVELGTIRAMGQAKQILGNLSPETPVTRATQVQVAALKGLLEWVYAQYIGGK